MSKRNKIIPTIAVPGFLAIGAIAAGAAGGSPATITTSGLTGVTDATAQQLASASQAPTASGDPGTKPGAHRGPGPLGGPGHGEFGNALDKLVTDGTITAAQQTKVADAYKAQEAKDTDAQEKLEHSDRAAWLDLILDPLVKDGTLTSDQAAKVKTVLSAARAGGPGGPGWGRGPGQGRGPGPGRDRPGDPGAPAQGSQNG